MKISICLFIYFIKFEYFLIIESPAVSINEDLIFQVIDHDPRTRDEILGKITIPLNYFMDQTRHNQWFDLSDNYGHITVNSLHLEIQWIHSKVYFYCYIKYFLKKKMKFLKESIVKLEETIKIQEEDIIEFENDLAILYEPFRELHPLIKKGFLHSVNDQNQEMNRNEYNDVEKMQIQGFFSFNFLKIYEKFIFLFFKI